MPTKADRTAGPDVTSLLPPQPCWPRRNHAGVALIFLSWPTFPAVTSRATHVTWQVQE